MNCRHCGMVLTEHRKVYCSLDCQKMWERSERTTRWLETGEGVPGTTPNHYIRLYIFQQQGGKCSVCGMLSEWNGAELRFVLDHIDGDSSNNKRDNLRLVCPNCDSQLPTFKSKNRGRGRHFRRKRYADGKSY